MAFDEKLAARIDRAIGPLPGITRRKMFGGLCYLDRGNMAFGLTDTDLMVRVGPDAYGPALRRKYARPMDFTGRPLTGMVYVSADGIKTAAALKRWLRAGLDFTQTLPAK